MLSLSVQNLAYAGSAVPASVRAPAASMMAKGGDLTTVTGEDMSSISKNMKGGARFNYIFRTGLDYVDQESERAPNVFGPPLTEASGIGWADSVEPKNKADMKVLAKKLNPVVGYWDPLDIVSEGVSPETIGWFRHAEIKHGRVAMAGFVGYLVHANGIHFPWDIQRPLPFLGINDVPTISFADISAAGSPGDMWDALPTAAKVQIICVVGFLEMWSETSSALELDGQKHYVRGGKPGYFPSLKGRFPHPVPLDLWDPAGFTAKLSPERKEKALLAEVNNGRLAMLGLFGLLSSSKGLIVPGLDSLPIAKYAGEYMAPFTAADSTLPYVADMVKNIGTYGYSL